MVTQIHRGQRSRALRQQRGATYLLLEPALDFLDAHFCMVLRLSHKQRGVISLLVYNSSRSNLGQKRAYKLVSGLHGWVRSGLHGVEDGPSSFLSESIHTTSVSDGHITGLRICALKGAKQHVSWNEINSESLPRSRARKVRY